ncbi:porin [Paraburkholderia unamae]|uniref:Porin n=1 Tax=Paraburkholderia unamae TaxID=219649 RepID=A0ABX5KNT1_9BURK|nr:porin [Paraburkholderia unamae]PVX83972.1 putative porin [Paraburkholderia unamae]CAG9265003.1 Porin protein [Paraburkholderia unamae]
MNGRFRLIAGACVLGTAVLPGFGHAQSSVTLYGTIDNALAWSSNQTTLGSAANGHHNFQMAPGTWDGSKFGFQGREDLGNGWAAIFNLMSRFNSANGNAQFTNAMFGQQAWVGMTNPGYGSLTLGRQLTSYYWMISSWSPTNWLTGFSGAHPGDIDNFDTIYKTSNTVLYKSPTFYGLSASGAYALGGVPGSLSTGSSWSAGLQYKLGAFGIGAGIERFNNATPGGGAWDPNSTASQAGQIGVSALTNGYRTAAAQQRIAVAGGYAITSNVDVSATYSNVQYVPGIGSAFRTTAVWNTFGAVVHVRVAAVWDLAAGYSYTRASRANGIASGAQYQQGSLAEYYSLSKQTGIYFLQAYQRAGGQTLGSDGISIIPATATIGDGFNSSPSATRNMMTVAAGLIHRF